MAKFWVDFSASIEIEATDESDAKAKLADVLQSGLKFIEIDGVEEITEN